MYSDSNELVNNLYEFHFIFTPIPEHLSKQLQQESDSDSFSIQLICISIQVN